MTDSELILFFSLVFLLLCAGAAWIRSEDHRLS